MFSRLGFTWVIDKCLFSSNHMMAKTHHHKVPILHMKRGQGITDMEPLELVHLLHSEPTASWSALLDCSLLKEPDANIERPKKTESEANIERCRPAGLKNNYSSQSCHKKDFPWEANVLSSM